MTSKQEQLNGVLADLCRAVPDVTGALLASRDGLAVASTLGAGEASRVAAMAATVLALGSSVVDTCELGEFEETVVQSDAGVFVVYHAGELAVLAVLARGDANLGLVHIEARRAADTVGRLLASYYEEVAGAGAAAPAPPTTTTTPPAVPVPA